MEQYIIKSRFCQDFSGRAKRKVKIEDEEVKKPNVFILCGMLYYSQLKNKEEYT